MSTRTDPVLLDDTHVRFFETFGFLHLPQFFTSEETARLGRAFDEVFETHDTTDLDPDNEIHNVRDDAYAQDVRRMIFEFIDRSPDLRWLRDDPRITGVVESLLGEHSEELPADGNIMNCDVSFHSDVYGSGLVNRNIKIFVYLDALTRDSGALRVIPGTNHHPSPFAKEVRKSTLTPEKILETFAVTDEELPAWPLEVEPGDLVVGDFRTVHASFGGAPGRRLFTMNYRVPPD